MSNNPEAEFTKKRNSEKQLTLNIGIIIDIFDEHEQQFEQLLS